MDRLMYFNKSASSKNNSRIDQIFVDLLLVSLFDIDKLKKGEIDADLLEIVKCKLNAHNLIILKHKNVMKIVLLSFHNRLFQNQSRT